jgi:hypothetical protein
MPPPRRAWRGFHQQGGADIGRKAIVVYVCQNCGTFHDRLAGSKGPPERCMNRLCEWPLAFDRFDSKTEAYHWAKLKQRERAKLIEQLRRQVTYPLLTVDERTGKPVRFGAYVADFVYRDIESGETIIEDSKGGAISPEAALKLRIMEASGRTVTLTKG